LTHSHVWHDSFTRVTWLIHMCDMTHSHVWRDSRTCVTWPVHMCDMARSYAWYNSLTHIWMSSYAWYDSFICATRSRVWHDSFICVIWLLDITFALAHSYVWYDSIICATFAKEPYKRDDILQKRPIILLILLFVATPYLCFGSFICVIWLDHMCDMTRSRM